MPHRSSVLFSLALAACSDNQIRVVNVEPEAEILVPVQDEAFVSGADLVTLRGKVGDADQNEDTLSVVWLSNVDGTLGADFPDSEGTTELAIPASEWTLGEHTVTLSVTDTQGLGATDDVHLTIVPPDDAPTVAITSPEDGASFDAGEAITFVGGGVDARDAATDLVYEWETDEAGVVDTGTLSSQGETRYTAALDEGDHTVTLRVTDTEGNSASDTVIVSVQHVNAPPSAEIISPATGSHSRVGAAATFTGLVSDPEDAAADLVVRWRSDVDGELASGVPDTDGGVSLTTADLSVGAHVITLEVEDGEGEIATASIDYEISNENLPPGVPTITISPETPTTLDDLVVTVITDAVDEDGDAVDYTYQWYRDSASMSGYTTDTVAASKTTKHEIWMVEVRATDGEDTGAAAVAEVLVINSAPSLSGASLSPDSPTVDDTITCTPSGWSDADGDEAGYDYAWTVDGASVAGDDTLSDAFSKDQVVGCTITPDDGEETGDPVSAGTVTVFNTAPEPPVLAIDPVYPVDDDALLAEAEVAAYDADGDTLTTTWTWTRDGAATSYSSATISASATALDEIWTVTATVSDGSLSATSDPAEVRIWPGEGEIIVTEFFPDPKSVSDARGEYVEIWNSTDTELSLDDHSLLDLDYDCVDLSGLTIGSKQTIVICVNTDYDTNGGVLCDLSATWDTGYTAGCNQLALSNTDDEVVVNNPAGDTDSLSYSTSWLHTGKATGLDPSLYSASASVRASSGSWCAQSSALSAGDKGTPGETNDDCP